MSEPTIEAPARVVAPSTVPEPAKVGDLNIAPTTTAAADLASAGQRHVNLIWEGTQAFAAKGIIVTALAIVVMLITPSIFPSATEKQIQLANLALMLITNMTNLAMGFYFGRTNHVKIGGVGQNEAGR